MQSLCDFSLPEDVQNFLKAELAKPFNYLEFGQDEQPEGLQYRTKDFGDGWYEGEFDQAGRPFGRCI